MIGGGLGIDAGLDGVWTVGVVMVFAVCEVEFFDVAEDREWFVERLQSEKESSVLESEVLGDIGEGEAVRCRASFGGGLLEGFPVLR